MSVGSCRHIAFIAPRQAALDAARAQRVALGLPAKEPQQDTSRITMATITPIFGRKEGK